MYKGVNGWVDGQINERINGQFWVAKKLFPPYIQVWFYKNEPDLSYCLVIITKYFETHNHVLDQETTIRSCLLHNLFELCHPENKLTTVFLPFLSTTQFWRRPT